MKKTLLWVVGIVVVILIVVSVAGKKQTEGGPIKIGFIGPLTGSLASIGESSLGGALLAVKEINDSGGILGRQLSLIVEDDKCSSKGLDAVTKLISANNVVAISGPDCSSSAKALIPFTVSKNVPIVLRWASAPSLTGMGPNIVRVYPSDAIQGKFVAEFIFNILGKKNVAILNVKNDWSQGITDVFMSTFESLGGNIVYSESVTEDSRDMRTQLQAIKKTNSEVLFAPLHEATGVVGLKQAKDMGISIPIVGGDVFDSNEVIMSSGAEGTMYSVALINNPEEFQNKVKNVIGKDGSKVTAPLGYDSIMVIADAIERAKSIESSAIISALNSTSISGVGTPILDFESNGDLKQAQFEVKVIKDGKSVKFHKI